MMCFRHQQPWHTDITCAEFDSSRLSGDPNYAQTQKFILETTKGCPECGVRITKGNGCFHMTCKIPFDVKMTLPTLSDHSVYLTNT